MDKKTINILKFSVLGALAVMVVAFTFCYSPVSAHATINKNIAYSEDANGNLTYYKKVNEALNDAYKGKTIVMIEDWTLRWMTTIDEGKKVTIDMNGHQIVNSTNLVACPALWVSNGAELNLKSTAEEHTFTYTGYDSNGTESEKTISTGGLITGVKNGKTAGGIVLADNAKCTIDNVAIAGNRGYVGGGVLIGKESNFYMKNGATIQYNKSVTDGGGIYVNGANSSIYMENSSIENNVGCKGAGVYSMKDGARVYLEKGSAISNNSNIGNEQGGGIYFDSSYSSVISADKTGVIKGNAGDIGAGVAFKGSHSGAYGCTIAENHARTFGGGIWTGSSDNEIENCTITNNTTNGGGSEGGGVYVANHKDITLRGKVIIKDNVRQVITVKNNSEKSTWTTPDDLFLTEGFFTDSYILGGVDAGSSVGIRTGSTSASRMIGKNLSTYYDDTYFMDLNDSYFVTHGNDHHGDLWQRRK